MKKYIEFEMDIYQLQPQDILNGSPEGGDGEDGGGDELPWVPINPMG